MTFQTCCVRYSYIYIFFYPQALHEVTTPWDAKVCSHRFLLLLNEAYFKDSRASLLSSPYPRLSSWLGLIALSYLSPLFQVESNTIAFFPARAPSRVSIFSAASPSLFKTGNLGRNKSCAVRPHHASPRFPFLIISKFRASDAGRTILLPQEDLLISTAPSDIELHTSLCRLASRKEATPLQTCSSARFVSPKRGPTISLSTTSTITQFQSTPTKRIKYHLTFSKLRSTPDQTLWVARLCQGIHIQIGSRTLAMTTTCGIPAQPTRPTERLLGELSPKAQHPVWSFHAGYALPCA